MKKLLLFTILSAANLLQAETVDFNKIHHWTGEGNHRAALVVQFGEEGSLNPGAIVWGYRWKDGEKATSDEMMCAIAATSNDLVILRQLTGPMGYTLDGIGYGPEINGLLSSLHFDLEGAEKDANISFGYMNPNTGMGQTSAPGQEIEYLMADAIETAKTTHVIEHPLNYEAYGYPAYDYDYWQLQNADGAVWQSGWYKGYWGFWTGSGDMNHLTYSGMGMSSVGVEDGQVIAWRFTDLSNGYYDEDDGEWLPLNYLHFIQTGIAHIEESLDGQIEIYTMDGFPVYRGGRIPSELKGLYIIRQEGKTTKKIFK